MEKQAGGDTRCRVKVMEVKGEDVGCVHMEHLKTRRKHLRGRFPMHLTRVS